MSFYSETMNTTTTTTAPEVTPEEYRSPPYVKGEILLSELKEESECLKCSKKLCETQFAYQFGYQRGLRMCAFCMQICKLGNLWDKVLLTADELDRRALTQGCLNVGTRI